MLWSDKDFEYCKLDEHWQGNITEEVSIEPKRIFRAYLENWEDVQFNRKGDDIHAAWVLAKYEGLGFYDDI